MGQPVAEAEAGGIVVRVEVDDADLALAVDVGERRRRSGYMSEWSPPTTKRDRAGVHDLTDERADGFDRAVGRFEVDGRIAVVGDDELGHGIDHHVGVWEAHLDLREVHVVRPQRAWAEGGTTHADRVVETGTEDGDIHVRRAQIGPE